MSRSVQGDGVGQGHGGGGGLYGDDWYLLIGTHAPPGTSADISHHYTCVNVPVLSEKMYSIWPSSSFSVVVRDWAGVLVFG